MKIKKNVVTFNVGTAATPINITLPHNYSQRIGAIDIDDNSKDAFRQFIDNVQVYEKIFITFPEALSYRIMCKAMRTQIQEIPDIENSIIEWVSNSRDSKDRESKRIRGVIRKIIDYTGFEFFKDQRVKSFCN
jgi:hypothetical protein